MPGSQCLPGNLEQLEDFGASGLYLDKPLKKCLSEINARLLDSVEDGFRRATANIGFQTTLSDQCH